MGISVKSRKMLWGKAASRCALPDCRKELVMDETETDDPAIIGEECHIIARKNNGPRGDSNLSKNRRDFYDNLILMCNNHHKVIDDQKEDYTIEKLKKMKKDHEEWVKNSLNIDEERIKSEIIYSNYIDDWGERAKLDSWKAWTSQLLGSGQPSIHKDKLKELEDLSDWMFSRILPGTMIELEDSFENFRRVLRDLINTFNLYTMESGGMVFTDKIYKINSWDPELHKKLRRKYFFHVDLVMDLTIELTRAANYVCDQVRKYILSNFRLEEGILVVTSGPFPDLSFKKMRIRYTEKQRSSIPYHNIDIFKKERENREFSFGIGRDVEEALKLDKDFY